MTEALLNFLNAHALQAWTFLWLCIGVPIAIHTFKKAPPPNTISPLLVILVFALLSFGWPAVTIFHAIDHYAKPKAKPKPKYNPKPEP